MKLHTLTPNCHLVIMDDGRETLFSYGEAIAGYFPGRGYYVAEGEKSKGSTKHINVYVRRQPIQMVSSEQIATLCESPVPLGSFVDNPV